MTALQPNMVTLTRRRFACSAAAVLAYIVNEDEQVLMLAHPKRGGWWEVINGALEAEESVLDGVLREVREEAGELVRVRPLGAIHIETFHYDENVPYMLSLSYLLAYEGGEVRPGDDMAGSEFHWWSLDEVMADSFPLIVPPRKWVMQRAVELYRLWKGQPVGAMELQPVLGSDTRSKYTV
jgi:8-oxo-dGTP pyrophosphatase MutT (NUDIX family)